MLRMGHGRGAGQNIIDLSQNNPYNMKKYSFGKDIQLLSFHMTYKGNNETVL